MIQRHHDTIYIISRYKLFHEIDFKFMIKYIHSTLRVITHLQWSIWESYALSCVYENILWDTQHTHTIADKLCGSRIFIKSCTYSTITIWIFLYCYHFISIYQYIGISCTSLDQVKLSKTKQTFKYEKLGSNDQVATHSPKFFFNLG